MTQCRSWTRARCRICWVVAAVLLYVPFALLMEHH